MISRELSKKYTMYETLEGFLKSSEKATEVSYYGIFLTNTDHIPNKIIEAQTLGKKAEDYTEVLNARDFARAEINRLQSEQTKVK